MLVQNQRLMGKRHRLDVYERLQFIFIVFVIRRQEMNIIFASIPAITAGKARLRKEYGKCCPGGSE